MANFRMCLIFFIQTLVSGFYALKPTILHKMYSDPLKHTILPYLSSPLKGLQFCSKVSHCTMAPNKRLELYKKGFKANGG